MPVKRVTAPLVLLALSSLAAPALARLDGDADHWCGTTRGTLAVAVGVHDEHERERIRVNRDPEANEKAAISAPSAEAVGDIAVLSDDGSILTSPNPVDVAGIGINYVVKGKGYQVTTGGSTLADPPPGTKLDLGDDDVRSVNFPKGFKFPFYTKKYTSMLVHSDGNITFGVPDAESTERSVQRFLNGPPRIAPFFVDLNPETAGEDAGVFVSTSKTAAIVTWYRLPQFGTSLLSTFQVTLDKKGKITYAFGNLEADEAVVGIAPGDGGAFRLVDYQSDPPVTVTGGAVAEQFSKSSGLDDMGIANMFFSGFADQYDHLVVFLDFPQILLGGGAFAYEFGVKNEIRGIGQQVFDASAIAGSHGRLRSFVQMGTIGNYPDNPDTTFLGTNSTMDILGQETGHRWLAFLRVNSPDNPALLGRALSHWNFNFNSEASDMEGNRIQDNGDGTFTTVASTEGFSPLDQYVMGLRAPSEVPDMFYVDGNTGNATGEPPTIGLRFHGDRHDFSIQDIIAAEGARVPAGGSAAAQKTFRMAFILVTKNGEAPKPGSVEKLDRIRTRWMDYFNQATEGRGTVETNLVPR